MSYDLSELLTLGTPEKLRLIGALWDSIDESPEFVRLTEAQLQEVRRRDAEMSADPDASADPDEVERLLKPDHG